MLHSGHFKHFLLAGYLLFILWIAFPPMSALCPDCLTSADDIIWLLVLWFPVRCGQGRHQQRNQRAKAREVGFSISLLSRCLTTGLARTESLCLTSLLGNSPFMASALEGSLPSSCPLLLVAGWFTFLFCFLNPPHIDLTYPLLILLMS